MAAIKEHELGTIGQKWTYFEYSSCSDSLLFGDLLTVDEFLL